ncbi:hypothetical protein [Planococcus koreensis]|uniref:hypothetical protein n=1 Tax=Planococcus koreensis TaxID=112331 RepID=UPI0039FD12BE
MNQFDIEAQLDRDLMAQEKALEKKLLNSQRIILNQLAAMYAKYEREGDLTYQEMQRYNRLEKELQRIAETLTAEYQQVIAQVQEMQENHYLLKFLLTAYLLDQFIARPSLPTTEVISAVFIFVIGAIKLGRPPSGRESAAVGAIEKALKEGINNGDSQMKLTSRIEKALPAKLKKTEGFTKQLTDALTERLEARVNVAGIKIPKLTEIRNEVKVDGLTLSHYMTVKRNRIMILIREQIGIALRKKETVSKMSRRIRELMGKEINSLRMFLREASDRARAKALGNAENQIAAISDVRGIWLSKRDNIVRKAHQQLEGQRTDRKGYFHWGGLKSMAPRMWGVPGMDNYCRCKKLTLLDFKVPIVAEGVEYNNQEYSRQLDALAKKKVEELGYLYEKAYAEAIKEIPEPWGGMPFVSFEEWLRKMGVKGDLSAISNERMILWADGVMRPENWFMRD